VAVCVLIFGAEMHRCIEERLGGRNVAMTSDRLFYPDGVNTVTTRPLLHFLFSCRSRTGVAKTGHRDDLIMNRVENVWSVVQKTLRVSCLSCLPETVMRFGPLGRTHRMTLLRLSVTSDP
jgi:hypothetical protein